MNKGRRTELGKLKQQKRAKNFGIKKEDAPSWFNKLKHTAKCCSCSICSPGKDLPKRMKHSDIVKSIYIE